MSKRMTRVKDWMQASHAIGYVTGAVTMGGIHEGNWWVAVGAVVAGAVASGVAQSAAADRVVTPSASEVRFEIDHEAIVSALSRTVVTPPRAFGRDL